MVQDPNAKSKIQDSLLDILTYKPERVVEPFPWTGHLPFAHALVQTMKPSIIVELGTHTGNSLCAFAQSVKKNMIDTKIFAVDTWKGDEHAGFYGDIVYKDLQEYISLKYPFVTLLRMTFDDAVSRFEDESIDLLHIDGLHTYEAVKHDLDTWFPKLNKGGVILLHDISEMRDDFGVYKLWEEIKKQFNTLEFQHSHGLGIAFMKDAMENEALMEFYKLVDENFLAKYFFQMIAETVIYNNKITQLNEKINGCNLREHKLIGNSSEIARRIKLSTLLEAIFKKFKRKIIKNV